jgi:hypothetical protein
VTPHPDPWAFGWEALAAFGTVSAAAVTAWVAWLTRRAVRLASEEQAATWRPVLLPASAVLRPGPNQRVNLCLSNIGAGPALEVDTTVDEYPTGWGQTPGRPLAAGEELAVMINTLAGDDEWTVRVAYSDMSGRRYVSKARVTPTGLRSPVDPAGEECLLGGIEIVALPRPRRRWRRGRSQPSAHSAGT